MTGRSFTTESSPLPWICCACMTTPCVSSVRSRRIEEEHLPDLGTQRIHPERGDGVALIDSGTVNLSSTLSASLIKATSRTKSSSESAGRVAVLEFMSLLVGYADRMRFALPEHAKARRRARLYAKHLAKP